MQSRLSKDCPKLQSEHGDGREDHDRGSRGNRACRQLRSGPCSHPRHLCGPDYRGAVVREAHRVSDDTPARGGTSLMPWTREEMAARAALELKDGFYVNLGLDRKSQRPNSSQQYATTMTSS